MSHKRIMQKASKDLKKDAKKYKEKMNHEHGVKKKHEKVEMKEAMSASKSMKKRALKAHEY